MRNGYYLPSETATIVTEEYLVGVANGVIWCPLYADIRLKPCVRPPSKQALLDKFT